ncbi:MAG: adenylate/guanylate cyclase domain-containing protein [Anaerolineales bacterium]
MDLRSEFPIPPKILIADDDWLNRDLLQTYLVSAGCKAESFPNGEQAWEAVQEGLNPDLAIFDIQMPRLDGLSLCKRFKNHPPTRFTPVVIVTALDAEEEKLRAIEVGADDFVAKPFNSVILLTRVRSLLRLKQLHDELESRNKLLRQVLNRYVDEEVANIILTDPERYLKLGGETRYVTVLFADLRGFTAFTEANSASQVVDTLNKTFTELVEVLFKHQGTHDKFLGDGIITFFGAPISQDDDALRALRAALEMQQRFANLQSTLSEGLMAPLKGLGIGVHSGEAIVGNIGAERAMDYTVIGDTVNVARRLQEEARPGEILISETTCQNVPQAKVGRLTEKALPGRSEPVMIYAFRGFHEDQ